ncbi:hypothetical protein BB561_001659 [Smittium simulii]|uniref:Uncharacterized protein n=1 Tax=Smittium simulii TaxID=133385 RepID=A0A2T9YTP8_9FUNG|nr:hypothetical protein BB561_001659 [Smittium simulii]
MRLGSILTHKEQKYGRNQYEVLWMNILQLTNQYTAEKRHPSTVSVATKINCLKKRRKDGPGLTKDLAKQPKNEFKGIATNVKKSAECSNKKQCPEISSPPLQSPAFRLQSRNVLIWPLFSASPPFCTKHPPPEEVNRRSNTGAPKPHCVSRIQYKVARTYCIAPYFSCCRTFAALLALLWLSALPSFVLLAAPVSHRVAAPTAHSNTTAAVVHPQHSFAKY